jgi:uncharacterized membrane protein
MANWCAMVRLAQILRLKCVMLWINAMVMVFAVRKQMGNVCATLIGLEQTAVPR